MGHRDVTEILEKLEQASPFELWRLTQTIDAMLKDPVRVHDVRSRLRVNQGVVYFDTRENKEIQATIVEIHRTNVLVKNCDDGKLWHIPFYMLKIERGDKDRDTPLQKIDRSTLKVGDQVGFLNRSSQIICGKVTKLNPKAAEVTLPTGEHWRVHYHALFPILEGECMDDKEKVLRD